MSLDDRRENSLELIVKYVSGHMSDSEAESLFISIQNDKSIFDLLLANVESDFILHKLFHLENSVDSLKGFDLSEPELFNLNPNEWSKLIAWEQTVKPIANDQSPRLRTKKSAQPEPDIKTGSSKPSASPQKRKQKRSFPYMFVLTVVLFFTVIGWAEWYAWRLQRRHSESFIPVACLTEMVDAVWTSNDTALKRGQEIASQKISLLSGLLRLDFDNGANIILQGPVEWVLNNSSDIFCNSGRLSAHIPPTAKGFVVNTPFAKVVDRGTDFYVDVKKNELNVQTIHGLVELSGPDERPVPLKSGQGSKITATGQQVLSNISTKQYISVENFMTKLISRVRKIKRDVNRRNIQLDENPSLLARFDLGRTEKGKVVNRAQYGRNYCSDLLLSSCETTTGSLYDTEAIAFFSPVSAAEFDLAGTYSSVTLVATVRIDRLDHQGNALLVGKNYFTESGAFLWQISKEGEMLFHITADRKDSCQTFASPPLFKRNQWGTWFTLAIVVDAKNRTVTQYCDGRKVISEKWDNPIPLTFGRIMMGNILYENISARERQLGGAFEQLIIYNRALTQSELSQ